MASQLRDIRKWGFVRGGGCFVFGFIFLFTYYYLRRFEGTNEGEDFFVKTGVGSGYVSG